MAELWGPVDASERRNVPCIVGRAATEKDVLVGHAVFFVEGESEAALMDLPRCALLLLEDGTELPVIVVQAELAPYGIILGLRKLGGGNAVCLESEVRMLPLGFPS